VGRPANPTPEWDPARKVWTVRITLPKPPGWPAGKPGPRIPKDLPGIAQHDADRAKRIAKLLSDTYRAGKATAAKGDGETVFQYAMRWLVAREDRIASIRDNKTHLIKHVLPVLGGHPITAVTPKEIEDVVTMLDRKVRAGELSAKTAGNIWGTCSKMFDDATHAKPAEGLRCLAKDPSDGVRGPDDDAPDKVLQFLYPSEVSAFMACADVPHVWKRNVAIAMYLCLRDGEQRALKWPSVDLEHGVVTICETYDRRKQADREGTKSGAARVVPIRPELMPLLEAMYEEARQEAEKDAQAHHGPGHSDASPVGLVCKLPSLRDMARGVRRWLKRAGVKRAQLHTGSSVSKQLRWHDMRATGLTWLAVEGRSPTEIRDIAGHTQTSMTDRYMRAAGILRGGRFGDVFPELPVTVLARFEGSEGSNTAASDGPPPGGGPPGLPLDPAHQSGASAHGQVGFESRPPRCFLK
jgi:integrase